MQAPFDLETIGAGLAFAEHTQEYLGAITAGACVVLAPPGSGKTTLVPPALANHLVGLGVGGSVLVTGPRRIAVRAAANRLSHLDGSELGGKVGYTIRGERAHSRQTLVEFLTPGVLLRRLLADPDLTGVGGVIIDEVHERSLETDLLIGMLTEVRQLRPDLFLTVMSATLEADKFSDLLGGIEIVESTGEQHPVGIHYRPYVGQRITTRGVDRKYLAHVATVASTAATDHPASDTLVFLPGRGEIDYVSHALRDHLPGLDVLPLHSGGDPSIQRKILRGRGPDERRRIIVATDVAESSLTVPGVHTVVDACFARVPRRDTRRGMSGLVTVTASQASAQQRAGRAGRQGPGQAYRCVSEAEFAQAPPHPTPQILTADLASAALMVACWGAPGAQGLPLADPMPAAALESAHAELIDQGALDEHLRPTTLGRRLSKLPLEPALGGALLQAHDRYGASAAAQAVALLSLDLRDPEINLVRIGRQLASGVHPATEQWRTQTRRLRRLLRGGQAAGPESFVDLLGEIAALGPGRIARREGSSYLLASGTRASLPPRSDLADEQWLVITDVARSNARIAADTGAIIRAAAPISRERILTLRPPASIREITVVQGRVVAREERRIGAIVESSTPVRSTPEENSTALLAHIRREGIHVLPWTRAATQLRGRLAALHHHLGEPWPDVSGEALVARADWLGPYITEPGLGAVPLEAALRSLIWDRAPEVARLTPESIHLPSGRHATLDYPYPYQGVVRASAKLQECFGMRRSPRILDGRLVVTLDLLSPAGRTLASSKDLEFFWTEVYPEVRGENRARYSKHPWPEDPWDHVATSATNRQLERRPPR